MLYFSVPITNGQADLATTIKEQPQTSFDVPGGRRYCEFHDGVTIRGTWQTLTEAQYNAAKPDIAVPDNIPEPKLSDLQAQIDDLGAGVVQVMLMLGGGA